MGEHEGRPYLVTPRLPGEAVATAVVDRRPERATGLRWIRQAAAALDAAHRAGVAQGDLRAEDPPIDAAGDVKVTTSG